MAVRVSGVVRLVRHGRAAAGWNVDPDPDLDDVGRQQAAKVGAELIAIGSLAVVTSPLLRCRSTARFYADRAAHSVTVEPAVAEIPSPEGIEMADRVDWLRSAMQGTWADLGPRYTSYRDEIVDFVQGCVGDTVIFSHFIAINAVIGACLDDDRLVIRRLDNCSVTTVAVGSDRLRLVAGRHRSGHADSLSWRRVRLGDRQIPGKRGNVDHDDSNDPVPPLEFVELAGSCWPPARPLIVAGCAAGDDSSPVITVPVFTVEPTASSGPSTEPTVATTVPVVADPTVPDTTRRPRPRCHRSPPRRRRRRSGSCCCAATGSVRPVSALPPRS